MILENPYRGSTTVMVCSLFLPLHSYSSGTSEPIWLNQVECSTSLYLHILQCSHNSIGSHECNHDEDVAVQCCKCLHNFSLRKIGRIAGNFGRSTLWQMGKNVHVPFRWEVFGCLPMENVGWALPTPTNWSTRTCEQVSAKVRWINSQGRLGQYHKVYESFRPYSA